MLRQVCRLQGARRTSLRPPLSLSLPGQHHARHISDAVYLTVGAGALTLALGWGVKKSLAGLREYNEDVHMKVNHYLDVGRLVFEATAGHVEGNATAQEAMGEHLTVQPPHTVIDTATSPLLVGEVSIEEKAEACFHCMRQNQPFSMSVYCNVHGSAQPGELHMSATVQGRHVIVDSIGLRTAETGEHMQSIPCPPLPIGAVGHSELDIPVELWQPWQPEEPVDIRNFEHPGHQQYMEANTNREPNTKEQAPPHPSP